MRVNEHLWQGLRLRERLALAGSLMAAGAASGQEWERQSPAPTAAGIYGAAFLTPQRDFVAVSDGALLETADGGRTWSEAVPTLGSGAPLYNVHFFDPQHGWTIGNNDDGYRTVDGGESWMRMPTPAGSWYEIEFFSLTSGVIGANGALAATSDGVYGAGASGPNDVWAVGFADDGPGLTLTPAMHWDGAAWAVGGTSTLRRASSR